MKPPKVDRGASDEKAKVAPAVKPQQEEKKRGGWGNNAGPRSNSNNGNAKANPPAPVQKVVSKKPTTNNVDESDAQAEGIESPDNRKKKQDDWNYLKQTLKSNNMMNGNNAGQGGE